MTEEKNKIEETQSLYARGNFKEARKLAREALEDTSTSDNEKALLGRILKATGIDPVATVAFSVTALLLAFLIIRYIF